MGFYSVVTYLSQSVNTNTDVYYRQCTCLKHDLAPTCLFGIRVEGRRQSSVLHHRLRISGAFGEFFAHNNSIC